MFISMSMYQTMGCSLIYARDLINCGRGKLKRPIIFNFTQLFKKNTRAR
jgi:hypothetical protein